MWVGEDTKALSRDPSDRCGALPESIEDGAPRTPVGEDRRRTGLRWGRLAE